MDQPPDHARCWTCNYELRGLATPRCPECGREFDPVNPNTMNLGKTPGTIGRFLLRRSGWLPIVILLVATGFVISATRWPKGGVMLTSLDLLYYFNSIHLRPKLLSYTDWAYTLGLLTAAAVVLLWLMKLPLREIARRMYRQPIPPPVNMGRRIMLGTLAIFAMGGSIAIGWPYRIARAWVREMMALHAGPWGMPRNPAPPVTLAEEQYAPVLRAAAIQLPTGTERLNGIKLLIEERLKDALPILIEAINKESDPHVRAIEVLLLALHGNPNALDVVLAHWDDPDAEVRAMVTDVVGLLQNGVPTLDAGGDTYASLNTTPAIEFDGYELNREGGTGGKLDQRLISQLSPEHRRLLASVRQKVAEQMTRGPTTIEREAAARALLLFKDDYHLRVAEWGVWIAEQGDLKLSKSIIDEIPPFVHRTGDGVAGLVGYVNWSYSVTKPILHVTVDQPMAIKVQVLIRDGRPWFAFPKPDDFALSAAMTHPSSFVPVETWPTVPVEKFDAPAMGTLEDPHTGYPWMNPAHPRLSPDGATGFEPFRPAITSLGVLWQSVIVSPEKLGWMKLPDVPADPKYDWWKRLREVPCGWISNRGESERFLYYDGPTASHSPVTTAFDGKSISNADYANPLPLKGEVSSFDPINSDGVSRQDRRGLFIRVDSSAQTTGCVIDVPGTTDLSKEPMLHGDALISRFHSLLTEAGLTDAEAAGLVDCWRPQFFQTPGSRFILLMSAYDYDRLCPIRIDPPPTELVRVGLVLTEFARN